MQSMITFFFQLIGEKISKAHDIHTYHARSVDKNHVANAEFDISPVFQVPLCLLPYQKH